MQGQTFKVGEEHHLLRLDIFLTQVIPDHPSRTFIKKLIESNKVLLNQKPVKAHHKVCTGDEVVVDSSAGEEADAMDVQPENIALDIFYQDHDFLVVHKPAGMLVHPTRDVQSGTVVNALLYHCRELSDAASSFRPGIVHRLDRETSGLLVVAKNNKAHIHLSRQFEKHRVNKRYVAFVQGDINFDEGIIDAPLGRSPRHFDKKSVSFHVSAKQAVTFYRVIERFSKRVTKVALFPKSGRTHQLRVHMAYIGHPILGDDKYGNKKSFPRLALHAQGLEFFHPSGHYRMSFFTPLPPEFSRRDF